MDLVYAEPSSARWSRWSQPKDGLCSLEPRVALSAEPARVVSLADRWLQGGRGAVPFSHTLATFCVASPVDKISFELT